MVNALPTSLQLSSLDRLDLNNQQVTSLINLSKISSFVSDFCQRKLRDPFLLPAGGGYCVPQHEESIGEVENPELSVEGCEEEANNDEGDSYDEDNGVPPFQEAAHEWHYNNLQ